MIERKIFFVGAGISIPSGLPSGEALTRKVLDHFLSPKQTDRIIAYYTATYPWFGKDFPRLEKVLDDAVKIFGQEALDLFEFLEGAQPNTMHQHIARYMVQNRCYAFTTNFDDCIEKVHPEIPVITATSKDEKGWGLIKLHGCMHQAKTDLGATLTNIQGGLSEHLRELLISQLNMPENRFVFAGYSGSDRFDITPIFSSKTASGETFSAQSTWLDHSPYLKRLTDNDRRAQLNLGPNIILDAFSSVRALAGNTSEIIDSLTDFDLKAPKTSNFEWESAWPSDFALTPQTRKLFASQLFASFGIGHESLRPLLNIQADEKNYTSLFLNACRDIGLYEFEYQLRTLDAPKFGELHRQLLVSKRLSGRFFSTFNDYTKICFSNSTKLVQSHGTATSKWLYLEAGLYFRSVFSQFPRGFAPSLILVPFEKFGRHLMQKSIKGFQDIQDRFPSDVSPPHMTASLHRINDYVVTPPQNRFLRFLIGKPNHCLDMSDMSGDLYVETDSFLGYVNHTRSEAFHSLLNIEYGFFRPKRNENNEAWLYFAKTAIMESYYVARAIKDFPGQIKALRFMERISLYKCNTRRFLKIRSLRKRRESEFETIRQEMGHSLPRPNLTLPQPVSA